MKPLSSKKTTDDDVLTRFYKEVGAIDPLSKEEQAELARKIHNGDQSARERLVKANVKFMGSIALKYRNNGLPLEDLLSEGYIGLWDAAQKYDETKGVKFLTYAEFWIRDSIHQALAKTGRTIRLPKNQVDLIRRIKKTISEFESEHGRKPTDEEIAEILNTTDTKVSKAIDDSQIIISIDTTFSEDDDRPVLDKYVVPDSEDMDQKRKEEAFYNRLKQDLKFLDPIEQYVVWNIKGLDYLDSEKPTVDDIAASLNKTKKEIQQIYQRGIRHLKAKDKGLCEFL